MRRTALASALLFAFLVATRLCHSGIVWVEEAYPAAAAIQMLHGKVIYRDFWFDKPPLTPVLYLLWGAHTGVALRVAGAVFLFVCCAVMWWFARDLWSPIEGLIAASLLAFFVTFEVPSAALALAPDLVMLLPHIAAVYLVYRGRAFAAGALAGVAMLVNPKGVFVLVACLVWAWSDWFVLLAGFGAVTATGIAVLGFLGALPGYYQQVWAWGALYSRSTFVDQPLMEGLRRTAAWAGFHIALLAAAACWCWRSRARLDQRFTLWAATAFIGVVLGWRFFPRYYFLLLPVAVLAASRGFAIAPVRLRAALSLLLLIPLVRFGPRYIELARGRESNWADTAMNRDSRAVASIVGGLARPGDSLLVWGYRPDIFMYTRMPAGTPFLDSQPLTGVIADRHLTSHEASAPALAAANRQRLIGTSPTFIVDGLGLYNPPLAIASYADLAGWLANYREVARTRNSVVYRVSKRSEPH